MMKGRRMKRTKMRCQTLRMPWWQPGHPKEAAQMSEKKPLKATLEGLIANFEKDRFTLVTAPIVLLLIYTVRAYLEFSFLNRRPDGTVFISIHNVFAQSLGLAMAITFGVFLFSAAAGFRPRSVANVFLLGFSMVMIGPIVDNLILGRTEPYDFINMTDMSGLGIGLLLQLVIIVTLALLYLVVKTWNIFKSLAIFLVLAVLMVAIGAFLPGILAEMLVVAFPYDGMQIMLGLISLLIGLASVLFCVDRIDRRLFSNILMGNLRLGPTLLFILASVAGIGVSSRFFLDLGGGAVVDMEALPYALVVFGIAFLLARLVLLLSDLHEHRTRRIRNWNSPLVQRLLSPRQYIQFSAIYVYLALMFAMVMGPLAIVLVVVCVLAVLAVHFLGRAATSTMPVLAMYGLVGAFAFLVGFFATVATHEITVLDFVFELAVWPGWGLNAAALAGTAVFAVLGALVAIPLLSTPVFEEDEGEEDEEESEVAKGVDKGEKGIVDGEKEGSGPPGDGGGDAPG
jgi:hypothetical protein